jgi:hypothetical protein
MGQMGKVIRALLLFCALASCGARDFSPPRDLENACAIVAERPRYLTAMRATERKWGIPIPVQMAVIHQESKFVGNARTPLQWSLGVIPMGRQSSAYGYAQALDGTWEEYQRETGNRSARREDIRDATDFMGWYMDRAHRRLGISKSDARNQSLASHEGMTGFSRQSYRAKPWLVTVAANVAARADRYEQQLRACRRI